MTIPYPHVPRELLRIGPFVVRWYGAMYVAAYLTGYWIIRARMARGLLAITKSQLDSLIVFLVVGMLVGARMMYAIAYNPGHNLSDPLAFLAIWHGGLSFHGAFIGMAIAVGVFARKHRVPFWPLADTLIFAGTPGLCFGRLGNFINAELYGRPTTVPWAMVFPTDPQQVPRHPSQLYEAICEGVILFLVLWALERRARSRGWYRPGMLTAVFLLGYGAFRFLLEFTREPDSQLGLVLGPFSMGQLLSAAMPLAGLALLISLFRP